MAGARVGARAGPARLPGLLAWVKGVPGSGGAVEWYVWPVGVRSFTVWRVTCLTRGGPSGKHVGSGSGAVEGTGTGVELQPGLSLVWLQASQSPWPLAAVVSPPCARG